MTMREMKGLGRHFRECNAAGTKKYRMKMRGESGHRFNAELVPAPKETQAEFTRRMHRLRVEAENAEMDALARATGDGRYKL